MEISTTRQRLDPKLMDKLNQHCKKHIGDDQEKLRYRERDAYRIQLVISGIIGKMGITGEVKMFGSFMNGFKTGSSDLDVVFLTPQGHCDQAVQILSRFSTMVPANFENITKIFKANIPLIKFTDSANNMEVDFCINNRLGVRNSLLLLTYCKYDERVNELGRLVKDWAKAHDVVGTADGCLNSYAYMLLVIHYLQTLTNPVVPNLQKLAKEPVLVVDDKWGVEDTWDTKFMEDISGLEKSTNTEETGELLIGFFHYYGFVFDWSQHAVCPRLNGSGASWVDKFSLVTNASEEQWYIEDPFDLKHNLAGKCSPSGRQRIHESFRETYKGLNVHGNWSLCCPESEGDAHYMKCRVSPGVSPQAMLEEFEEFNLQKLYFPKFDVSNRLGQAYLEFAKSSDRRRAHTRNETYVADCQLQLHYSTRQGLGDVLASNVYSTYDMASYKMQREILQARSMEEPKDYQEDDDTGDYNGYDDEQFKMQMQMDAHNFIMNGAAPPFHYAGAPVNPMLPVPMPGMMPVMMPNGVIPNGVMPAMHPPPWMGMEGMPLPPMDWGAQPKDPGQMMAIPKSQKGLINKPLEKASNEVPKAEMTRKEKQKAAKEQELARRALPSEMGGEVSSQMAQKLNKMQGMMASQPQVLKPPPPPPLPPKDNGKKSAEVQQALTNKVPQKHSIGIMVDVSHKWSLAPDDLAKLQQLRKWQQTLPPQFRDQDYKIAQFLNSQVDVNVDVDGQFSEKMPPSFIKEPQADKLQILRSKLARGNTGMYNGQRKSRAA